MIEVTKEYCKIEGRAVNLMTELVIVMRRLRSLDSNLFDDECFNMCVALSAKSDEDIRKESLQLLDKMFDKLMEE